MQPIRICHSTDSIIRPELITFDPSHPYHDILLNAALFQKTVKSLCFAAIIEMTGEDYFSERYKSGKAPWEIGKPDFNLIEVVSQKPIPNCKALDIGCGTGDDAIWLVHRNFDVVGIDTSNIAVEKAREKADQSNVSCTFMVADFLHDKIDGLPFGFVFDRGCFHSFDSEDDRNRFAENVAAHLKDGGLWLTIVGNADEKRDGPGPPQRTATDIVLAVEPYFEILILQSGLFGSNSQNPPRAWRCLMLKR